MRKFVLAVAVLSLGLMTARNASAGDIWTGTLAQWRADGSETVGDKTFTYSSSSGLTDATTIAFYALTPTVYSDVIGNLVTSMGTGTNADLQYSVSIDPVKGAGLYFGQAQLDVNSVGLTPDFGVTKSIYSDSAQTNLVGSIYHNNINAPSPIDLTGGGPLTTIYVNDSLYCEYDPSHSDRLSNVTDTFSQVPEPSTFALLGLGGLGLAARAYRRRQTKVVA